MAFRSILSLIMFRMAIHWNITVKQKNVCKKDKISTFQIKLNLNYDIIQKKLSFYDKVNWSSMQIIHSGLCHL